MKPPRQATLIKSNRRHDIALPLQGLKTVLVHAFHWSHGRGSVMDGVFNPGVLI